MAKSAAHNPRRTVIMVSWWTNIVSAVVGSVDGKVVVGEKKLKWVGNAVACLTVTSNDKARILKLSKSIRKRATADSTKLTSGSGHRRNLGMSYILSLSSGWSVC